MNVFFSLLSDFFALSYYSATSFGAPIVTITITVQKYCSKILVTMDHFRYLCIYCALPIATLDLIECIYCLNDHFTTKITVQKGFSSLSHLYCRVLIS